MPESEHYPVSSLQPYVEGDSFFDLVSLLPLVGSELISIGEGKTTGLDSTFLCWDTTIPAGATINRATIEAEGYETSTVNNAIVDIAGLGPGLWDKTRTIATQNWEQVISKLVSTSSVSLGATTQTSNGVVARVADIVGVTSVGQVILATATGTLGSMEVYARRYSTTGDVSSIAGLIWFELYSSTGSSGSFREDALLASSDNIRYDDITASQAEALALTTITFSGANQITINSGSRYVLKLKTDSLFNAGDTTTQTIDFGTFVSTSTLAENSIYFGALEAFSFPLFPVRTAYSSQAITATETRVTSGSTTADTVETWGSTAKPAGSQLYTPDSTETSHEYTFLAHTLNPGSSAIVITATGATPEPAGLKVGDFVFATYSTDSTSVNFSLFDLDSKWWKVTAVATNTFTIEWDDTWDGVSPNSTIYAPAATFWVTKSGGTPSGSGLGTEGIRIAVQECVNTAGFTGRVGIRLLTSDTSPSNSLHRFWSEDATGGKRGAKLIVNWQTPAATPGVSIQAGMSLDAALDAVVSTESSVAAVASTASAVDAASGLSSSISTSATLQSRIDATMRLN